MKENLAGIREKLRAASGVALFLDFDGTLAPIVDSPADARLPPAARAAVDALASQENVTVAIVSGRSIADLAERVGLENVIYSGNHGLEIRGLGLHFVHPEASERSAELETLSRQLAKSLEHIAGIEVENKGFTASVHFRRTPPGQHHEVRQIVQSVVIRRADLFRVEQGRCVHEILPRLAWHKGAAVHWIRGAAGLEDRLTIYMGDDTTDERAFQVLPNAITVRVGTTEATLANYAVENEEEVLDFLVWLKNGLSTD